MVESIQGAGGWRPEVDFENGDPAAGPPEDATSRARAVRAAADARYQAFIASGPPANPCLDFAAPGHDYDRCVRVPVPNAVLFQREGADADAVDPRDVQQGGLGDCHFLAPLAALASTPEGRAALRPSRREPERQGRRVQLDCYVARAREPSIWEYHVPRRPRSPSSGPLPMGTRDASVGMIRTRSGRSSSRRRTPNTREATIASVEAAFRLHGPAHRT